MKLVFCIDDRGGMMFNKRRVSRDRILIENLAELIGDNALYIEPYSEELFSEQDLNIICSRNPVSSADKEDFSFIESIDPQEALSCADELIIYKWNRKYPSELRFTESPEKHGFCLAESFDFTGSSHEKITREIYKRNK